MRDSAWFLGVCRVYDVVPWMQGTLSRSVLAPKNDLFAEIEPESLYMKEQEEMRNRLYVLALASFAILAPVTLSASNITYTVNETVGVASVTGTIVTDGTIGTLSSPNIVSFNLSLYDGTGTATLNNISDSVYDFGDDLSATSTLLQFNFNGNGSFLNFYSPSCSPAEWSLYADSDGQSCNGATGNEIGVSAVLPFPQGVYSQESGLVTIGEAGDTVVPEPSSFMLLGSGLAGFAAALRRKFSR